ncbi:hypothetical protein I7I53_03364 [Histoplasma capsulatum var. duboisii H88]|uniref:Uncharacterized protein n=1 Tax=Ajellomyces capsulatus (strain H88) TaxID=544711 RepID=A0A8A1LND4_AJEC8|nr:hypothetical protein I7I53_03364 [Histoplasma capsulatum var. duboisii H88]
MANRRFSSLFVGFVTRNTRNHRVSSKFDTQSNPTGFTRNLNIHQIIQSQQGQFQNVMVSYIHRAHTKTYGRISDSRSASVSKSLKGCLSSVRSITGRDRLICSCTWAPRSVCSKPWIVDGSF